jgi:ferredoxin
MASDETRFQAFLDQHDDDAWAQVIGQLLPAIHPVDQAATRVWFAFFPLRLHRALSAAADPARAAREMLLEGKYRLAEQADTSAEFLYGHRHWPEVKRAVADYAAAPGPKPPALADQIREVARQTAERLRVEPGLLLGITAVAFMTRQQVGPETFGQPAAPGARWAKSPAQVVRDRARDDSQGVFGFLKTIDREYTVTFRETEPQGAFRLVNRQHLTTAAARDKRDYQARDPRCIEGPIPVECRSGSCGSCWVGVLSDTAKLSEPGEREITRMKECGYAGFTPERGSLIRLACQTQGHGNVTVVIPPWNGVIGKL